MSRLTPLLLVFLFAAGAEGGAQDPKGRRFKGAKIQWMNIDHILDTDGDAPKGKERDPRGDRKFMFVHISPVGDERESNEFFNPEYIIASRGEWAFVRMEYDKDNVHQKNWGVKTAPYIIGADIYGNEFMHTAILAPEPMQNILHNLPETIAKFETKLKSDYAKAAETFKIDESRGVRALVEIALQGKVGYKEVSDANSKLAQAAEAAFAKCEVAESVDAQSGIDYLEEIIRLYKTTPPGVQAEVRIAKLERMRENVPMAIQRLQKILKYDSRPIKKEYQAAETLLNEITQEGYDKIKTALAGDRPAARKTLQKVAKDYAGTEAGKRAAEEGRKLE